MVVSYLLAFARGPRPVRQLPDGEFRFYNLIELDNEGSKFSKKNV